MAQLPLPTGWKQMLDHIGERVAEALTALDQHERACPPESAPKSEVNWPRLEDQQSWLTGQLQRIEGQISDIDEELRAGENELKRHLREVERLGSGLKSWLNHASGDTSWLPEDSPAGLQGIG